MLAVVWLTDSPLQDSHCADNPKEAQILQQAWSGRASVCSFSTNGELKSICRPYHVSQGFTSGGVHVVLGSWLVSMPLQQNLVTGISTGTLQCSALQSGSKFMDMGTCGKATCIFRSFLHGSARWRGEFVMCDRRSNSQSRSTSIELFRLRRPRGQCLSGSRCESCQVLVLTYAAERMTADTRTVMELHASYA